MPRATALAVPAIVAVASALILGAAIASQVWGGLSPCQLCLYQRIPYAFTIALGLLGAVAVVRSRRRLAALAMFVSAVAFVLGAAVAAYHVGVEQGWWQGSLSCTGVPAGA